MLIVCSCPSQSQALASPVKQATTTPVLSSTPSVAVSPPTSASVRVATRSPDHSASWTQVSLFRDADVWLPRQLYCNKVTMVTACLWLLLATRSSALVSMVTLLLIIVTIIKCFSSF